MKATDFLKVLAQSSRTGECFFHVECETMAIGKNQVLLVETQMNGVTAKPIAAIRLGRQSRFAKQAESCVGCCAFGVAKGFGKGGFQRLRWSADESATRKQGIQPRALELV